MWTLKDLFINNIDRFVCTITKNGFIYRLTRESFFHWTGATYEHNVDHHNLIWIPIFSYSSQFFFYYLFSIDVLKDVHQFSSSRLAYRLTLPITIGIELNWMIDTSTIGNTDDQETPANKQDSPLGAHCMAVCVWLKIIPLVEANQRWR